MLSLALYPTAFAVGHTLSPLRGLGRPAQSERSKVAQSVAFQTLCGPYSWMLPIFDIDQFKNR